MAEIGSENGSELISRRSFLKIGLENAAGAGIYAAAKTFIDPSVRPLAGQVLNSLGLTELNPSLKTETVNNICVVNNNTRVATSSPSQSYLVSVNFENMLSFTSKIAQLLNRSQEFQSALEHHPLTISLGERTFSFPISNVASYLPKSTTQTPRVCLPTSFLKNYTTRVANPNSEFIGDPPEYVWAHELTHAVCDIVDLPLPITNIEKVGWDILAGWFVTNMIRPSRRGFIKIAVLALPYFLSNQFANSVNPNEQLADNTAHKILENPEAKAECSNLLQFKPI